MMERSDTIGDGAGGPLFTHPAACHVGIVIRNALFKLPVKVDHRAVPWVAYTEAELDPVGVVGAHAGGLIDPRIVGTGTGVKTGAIPSRQCPVRRSARSRSALPADPTRQGGPASEAAGWFASCRS